MIKRIATSLAALCIGALPAHAQPVTVLGPDLEPTRYTLREISADGIELLDQQGNATTLAADQVLRLTFNAPPLSREPGQVAAMLVDGQVMVGRLSGAGAGGESVRMTLAADDREAALPLDDLMALTLQPKATPPKVQDDDAVLLATGETLVGFVETLDDVSVGFIVGDADDPIDLPLERVYALSIANKPEPAKPQPGKALTRVRMADGSVYVLEQAETSELAQRGKRVVTGRSTLPIVPPALSLPLGKVVQIEPVSSKYSLVALADTDRELIAGGEVFGVSMPPRVAIDATIRLHAPTTLRFDLPKGASRLVFEAALDLGDDIAASSRALAGCELVVEQGGEPIGGCMLNADGPAQRINLPLKAGPLTIELRPGVNGPVLDRVKLTNAELLITGP